MSQQIVVKTREPGAGGARPFDTTQFRQAIARTAQEVETLLEGLLTHCPERGEITRPARLLEAMRYATLGSGKRIHPLLVIETRACSVPIDLASGGRINNAG